MPLCPVCTFALASCACKAPEPPKLAPEARARKAERKAPEPEQE